MEKLVLSIDLKEKLTAMNNDVAKWLLSLEETEDINYLGISQEDPNKMSYLDKNRILKIADWNFWNKDNRYHAKIGKILNKLNCPYSDKEKEEFNRLYKGVILQETIDTSEITIVKGLEIATCYLEDNYYLTDKPDDKDFQNSIWESCMRYESCENYFGIYTDNANVSMAVMYSPRGKVKGRCILWKHGEDTLYDRIYGVNVDITKYMQAALEKKGFINISTKNYIPADYKTYKVKINYEGFDNYPYIDTLQYAYNGFLSNNDSYAEITFDNTDGGSSDTEEEDNTSVCAHCDDSYFNDHLHYMERGTHRGDNLCSECSEWSEVHGERVFEDDCVDTDEDGWVYKEYAVDLANGNTAFVDNCTKDIEDNWFYDGDEDYVKIDGNWYHEEHEDIEFKEETNEWHLKSTEDVISI